VTAGESEKSGRWLWSNLLAKAATGSWPLNTFGLSVDDEKCQCRFADADVSVNCTLAHASSSFILTIYSFSESVLKHAVSRLK